MTQKTINIFTNKIYSKGQKQNCISNKTDVYHIDDIRSLDILDSKIYSPEKHRGYRYVLVVIDNSTRFSWPIPFKNENAENINKLFCKNSDRFEKITQFD